MRKRYILLKDTPEYKKGSVFEEECEDGTQDFKCINHGEFVTIAAYKDRNTWIYSRKVVVDQPEWFEEVQNLWLTPEQIKKIKNLLGSAVTSLNKNKKQS